MPYLSVYTVTSLCILYKVISRGSIQEHNFQFDPKGTTSAVVSFELSSSTHPNIKVLGVFAREDGELVADLIELSVSCELEHKVMLILGYKHCVLCVCSITPGCVCVCIGIGSRGALGAGAPVNFSVNT